MRASDFEIRNYEKLDRILAKLCDLVDKGQQTDSKKFGMVGAAVLDPSNQIVASTSTFVGKWRHAERNAIDKYVKTHGDIPEGSIIITTCSPCSETMNDRYGESCTDLINQSVVKKVYCGFIDPTQEEEHRDFNLMETANESIRDKCKELSDSFLDLDENFADGRNPQDKGDSKRYGINTKASVSSLRKTAKQGGRKGQLAHWLANMKAGRAKKK